jgi:hypothetical protein
MSVEGEVVCRIEGAVESDMPLLIPSRSAKASPATVKPLLGKVTAWLKANLRR